MTEGCRLLRFPPKHGKTLGYRWSTGCLRSVLLSPWIPFSLMANIQSDFLGLRSQFTGLQRREPGSSEMVEWEPSDWLRLLSCRYLMGLWFALQVVLFLKAYSLFFSSACICLLPMHSEGLTLQKRALPTSFKCSIQKQFLGVVQWTEFQATASNFQQDKICWSPVDESEQLGLSH